MFVEEVRNTYSFYAQGAADLYQREGRRCHGAGVGHPESAVHDQKDILIHTYILKGTERHMLCT